MGRVSEIVDYLTVDPKNLTADYKTRYTHIDISPELKEARRKFKLWKNNSPGEVDHNVKE